MCPFCGTESPYTIDRDTGKVGGKGPGCGAARPARRRAAVASDPPQRPVPELPRGDGLRGRARGAELRVLRLAGAGRLRRDQVADPPRGRAAVPHRSQPRARRHSPLVAQQVVCARAGSARAALVDTVRSLYIPYWTFDAHAHCPWEAEAGHYYYVNVPGRDSKGARSCARSAACGGSRRRASSSTTSTMSRCRGRRGCRSTCCGRWSRFRPVSWCRTTPPFSPATSSSTTRWC